MTETFYIFVDYVFCNNIGDNNIVQTWCGICAKVTYSPTVRVRIGFWSTFGVCIVWRQRVVFLTVIIVMRSVRISRCTGSEIRVMCCRLVWCLRIGLDEHCSNGDDSWSRHIQSPPFSKYNWHRRVGLCKQIFVCYENYRHSDNTYPDLIRC